MLVVGDVGGGHPHHPHHPSASRIASKDLELFQPSRTART